MIVTQSLTTEEIEKLRRIVSRKRFSAFNQWLRKLSYNDRLPRGKYFVGKRSRRMIVDELWMLNRARN